MRRLRRHRVTSLTTKRTKAVPASVAANSRATCAMRKESGDAWEAWSEAPPPASCEDTVPVVMGADASVASSPFAGSVALGPVNDAAKVAAAAEPGLPLASVLVASAA